MVLAVHAARIRRFRAGIMARNLCHGGYGLHTVPSPEHAASSASTPLSMPPG
jgi:hypothetical protein